MRGVFMMTEFKYVGNKDQLYMTHEQRMETFQLEIAHQLKRIADQMRK